MMNILYLVNELNYTDGVTSHLYYLLKELKKNRSLNLQIVCVGGNSVDKFKAAGLDVTVKKELCHSRRSYKNFIGSLKFIIKFIRQNKISVIHSHNHYAANLAFIASGFCRTKTIQTNHGIIPQGGMLKHFRAHKYIAVNDHIRDYILKNKITDKKNVCLIRHGIEKFSCGINKDKESVSIICAARFIKEKNIETFIHAAAYLNDSRLKFFLCGKGDEEEFLKSLNKKLNANVIFLNEVKNMPEVLSQTDIFVMTTCSESEGFPVIIAEAAIADNLIITTEFRGLSPVFVPGEDGLTFKKNDPKQLSHKILYAVNNSSKIKFLQKNFTAKVKKIFDLKKAAGEHLRLYSEVIK